MALASFRGAKRDLSGSSGHLLPAAGQICVMGLARGGRAVGVCRPVRRLTRVATISCQEVGAGRRDRGRPCPGLTGAHRPNGTAERRGWPAEARGLNLARRVASRAHARQSRPRRRTTHAGARPTIRTCFELKKED